MATNIEMAAARRLIADTQYEYTAAHEPLRSPENTAISGWLNGRVVLKDTLELLQADCPKEWNNG